MENSVDVPQKINKELLYDPANLLLNIFPKKTKNNNLKRYMAPYVHCCIIY